MSPLFLRLESQLSKAEQKELRELETVIQKGWATFLEVGKALVTINQKRLYRDAFATFGEYCDAKGLSRPYAYSLIGSAEVHEQMSAIADIQAKPATESQYRELLPVPKENRVEAWKDAIELAGNEPMTAKIVREAAAKHKPGNNGKPKPPKSTPAKRGDLGTALKLLTKAEKAASDREDSEV